MKKLILLAVSLSLSAHVMSQTLVAGFPFNGNANDESTNANSGTVFGATLTEDRFGNSESAYLFDGVDDYIDFGSSTAVDLKDGFSISAWFKLGSDQAFQTIVSRGYGGDGEFTLSVSNEGSGPVIRIFMEGAVYVGTQVIPVDGNWNHVTFIAQTGSNALRVYLNGELYLSTTSSTDLVGSSIYNLHIGNNDRDDSYFFNGALDDVAIYDGVLTLDQIDALSNPNPPFVEVFSAETFEKIHSIPGVVYGATPTEDRFGLLNSAYSYDGIDDYIDFGKHPLTDLKDGFTVSAWFQLDDDAPQEFGTIVGRGYFFPGEYELTVIPQGLNSEIGFYLEGNGYTARVPINSAWNHVALVVASGEGNTKLYYNGEEVISETSVSDFSSISNTILSSGEDNLSGTSYITGGVDEIKIFDGALTAEQISDVIWGDDFFPIDAISVDPDFGNALDFGTDTESWVSVPALPWNDLRSFSFETWVNYSGADTYADGDIAYVGLGAGAVAQNWVIGRNRVEINYCPRLEGFSCLTYFIDYSPSYDVGWNHFAFVVNEVDGTGKIFVNGQPVETTNSYSSGFTDFSDVNIIPYYPQDYSDGDLQAFFLGRDQTTSNYFKGALDETRVWNYAITESELSTRMNLPLDGNEEGLVYYFDYNQGIPGGDNGSVVQIEERKNNSIGSLFGFTLSGNQSNWIEFENINRNAPKIFSLDKSSSIPGEILTIYGQNFVTKEGYTKVFIGDSEAEILSFTRNNIQIIIPEANADLTGIKVLTSRGVSEPFDFSIISNQGLNFTFKRKPLKTDYLIARDIATADMNNDGFIDLISSSGSSQEDILIFYNNNTFDLVNGDFGGTPFSIPGTTAASHKSIFVIDLNGDSKPDILANYDSPTPTIEWFDNANGFTSSTISIDDGSSIYPGDLDVDGDIDICVLRNNELSWYRNDGLGSFSPKKIITTETVARDSKNSFSIADIDGDGDQDIILGSNAGSNPGIGAQLLINDGGGNFEQNIIRDNIRFFLGYDIRPEVVDYDADGDFDILFGGTFNSVDVFTNDGNLNFEISSPLDIDPPANYPRRTGSVSPGDFNGDGRIDFVSTGGTYVSNSLDNFWLAENTGSEGLVDFDLIQIESNFFTSSTGTPPQTKNADLDNDGDLDLITISEVDNQISVYKNVFTDNFFTWFALSQEVAEAFIDPASSTVIINVENGTNLSELTAFFEISENASIAINGVPQVSGLTINSFTNPVFYEITSESGDINYWTVQVSPLPSVPRITDVTNITQTSALVKWTTTTFTTGYEVYVSADGFVTEDVYTSETNSVELSLDPGIEYDVLVLAFNDYGESEDFSQLSTFSTIPATPTLVSLEYVDTEAAIILWDEILGADQYRMDVGLDETFTNFLTGYNSKVISTAEEVILGLSAGTEYWIRLRSQNESGLSPTSDVISFITLSDIATITFDNITQSGFRVKWNNVTGADVYELEVFEQDAFILSSDINEYTFSDLAEGNTFFVRLRSENISGFSEWSEYKEVTLVPPNPMITSINEISESSGVVNWNESIGASGYILDVARDAQFNDLIGGYGARRVSALSESIIGLSDGTNYYVRVKAANAAGTSDYSDVAPFLTLPETPTFTQSSITFDQVKFNWTVGTGQDGFDILQVVDGDSTVTSFPSTSTQAIFNNLTPATFYQFSIRSFNASGVSEYAIPISITTVPASVEAIGLDNISQREAVLSWVGIEGADDYLLEISENDFATNISGYNPKRIAGTSELIENLKAGVAYKARIRSSNGSGPSQYSEELSFTTVPANPTARDASNITSTSFNANWDNVEGNVDYYLVEVATDEGFQNQVVSVQVEVLTAAIIDLSEGVSHWYRIASGNASGESDYSNSVAVKQALVIDGLSFTSDPSKQSTTVIPVRFNVKGGTNMHAVTIRYRGILSDNWTRVPLASESNQYQFDVLPSFMDEIGLEFEILVGDGISEVSLLENFIYWSDIEEEVNTISLSDQWQMFSIPYVLDDPQVAAIFDEMLSLKYSSQWRLQHYNGQNYLDANGGGIADIELGKGYWFYTTEEVVIDIGSGSVNTNTPFRLSLRQGWNQIGNPYNVSINWASVKNNNQANTDVEELLLYDPSTNLFAPSASLSPFDGAFVWSNVERDVLISLADDKSLLGRTTDEERVSGNTDLAHWQLDFTINTNRSSFPIASIGMHPKAKESRDEYDRVTYPRFLEYVEMYTIQSDYFYPYFRKDIRPSSDQSTWSFNISSNYINTGTITWDNSDMQQSQNQLWLVDEKNGKVVHMNTTNSYSSNFSNNYPLTFHLTQDLTPPLPLNMHLSDPYPNPTKNQSTIQLVLPDGKSSYTVRLSIVDLSGKEIAQVAKGIYPAGKHEFTSDLEQFELKSGVYFYRLELDDVTSTPITKKLILIK